jgi:hypothetical protein
LVGFALPGCGSWFVEEAKSWFPWNEANSTTFDVPKSGTKKLVASSWSRLES